MGSSVILPAPGQPVEGPDPHFVNASQALKGTYSFAGMQPPTPYYLTQDDTIIIQFSNSAAGISPSVSFRYIDVVTGQLRFGGSNVTPPATKLATAFPFVLGEVFLLSLSVGLGNATIQRGQCFVVAAISRGFPNAAINAGVLFADYLTENEVIGWPGGSITQSVSESGFLQRVTVATPAAGADWTITVPAHTRWRVTAGTATLTTSATVANRIAQVKLDDGATAYFFGQPNQVVPASQTVSVNISRTSAPAATNNPNVSTLLPPESLIPSGHRISSSTTNIQAADTYTAISIFVEEWVDP